MVQRLLGGEAERTEAKLRAALDGLQMAVGDDDASTANAMTNLALFLKGEKKYEEATRLCTTALETRYLGKINVSPRTVGIYYHDML